MKNNTSITMCKIAIVLTMGMLLNVASADTATVNGITWTYVVSNGEASVIGISSTTSGAITIPSSLGGCPVTSIMDIAFSSRTGLTSVTIPNSVTSIGVSAFSGCSGLTSVTIPDSVTSIGGSAFENCSGLTSVTIPSSVTNIGHKAFYRCSGLTNITILGNTSITYNVGEWGSSSSQCFAGCPAYEQSLYRLVLGNGSSYDLAKAPADRAIASVTVNTDCAIDEFVLKDGKVYDSAIRIVNTASRAVRLTLPAGYEYETFEGVDPLTIPANSRNMLSITRTAERTFLVTRKMLKELR